MIETWVGKLYLRNSLVKILKNITGNLINYKLFQAYLSSYLVLHEEVSYLVPTTTEDRENRNMFPYHPSFSIICFLSFLGWLCFSNICFLLLGWKKWSETGLKLGRTRNCKIIRGVQTAFIQWYEYCSMFELKSNLVSIRVGSGVI